MIFFIGILYYIPMLSIMAALLWLIRRSQLAATAKRSILVGMGVLLLTPVPSPVATMYATFVPSGVVWASGDPLWYLRFWRFAAVAGVITWFMCWMLAARLVRDSADPPRWATRTIAGGAFVAVAIVLLVAPYQAVGPLLTNADGSCHDILLGKNSIAPFLYVDADLPESEWPTLARLFQDFGRDEGLDFEQGGMNRPSVRGIDLSLCAFEQDVLISASEYRWASRNFEPRSKDRGMGISFFYRHSNLPREIPRTIAKELVERLETQWPQRVRFRAPDGFVSKEEAMSVWEGYYAARRPEAPTSH